MGASIRHLFTSCILPAALHLPPTWLIHIPRLIYESIPPRKVHFPRNIWLLSLQMLILHG